MGTMECGSSVRRTSARRPKRRCASSGRWRCAVNASTRYACSAALLLLPVSLGACDWFTNFTRQPKIDPWEVASMDSTVRDSLLVPRGNPQGSVPMFGGSPPDFVVSYGRFPLTVDSRSSMRMPTPPSDSSLANDHRYYAINCAVCHGDLGDGNGSVTAAPYNYVNISLRIPIAMGHSDG